MASTSRSLSVWKTHSACRTASRYPCITVGPWPLPALWITRIAGFEWGSGYTINPTPPEEAARYLREVTAEEGS